MNTSQDLKVKLMLKAMVTQIEVSASGKKFRVFLKSGEIIHTDAVLLATGGNIQGHWLAESLGHSIVPPVPSLFTFKVVDSRLEELAGLSVPKAAVKLVPPPDALKALKRPQYLTLTQSGPLLITHWGFSGPAVLKASAFGARVLHECKYRCELVVDWIGGDVALDTVRDWLISAKSKIGKRAVMNNPPEEVGLPKRLWTRLCNASEIDGDVQWAQLSNQSLNALLDQLKRGQYMIKGKGEFKEEFVTAGGVPLDEVDMKTMESRKCSGLYFAGEVLDIDGITGGFNFQNAWTTGYIAGSAMAQSLTS
mmetsp:Transcript_43245/g.70176  ORF Transcript_43245/g.70176 Transcript_43245/m.70176 type:complete len:308 (-) Transcript_43245:20-943(-)